MSAALRNLLELLTRHDRVELFIVLAVVVVLALVEMLGIASIMPFMAVATSPDVIHENSWLAGAYDYFGFEDEQSFLMLLGSITLGLLVTGNLIKATNTWLTLRFLNRIKFDLGKRLLSAYMAKPYSFFLNRNSSELSKNILAEVQNVVIGVIRPATILVSNGLTSLAIIALVVLVDPIVALGIAVVLGGAYGGVYALTRRKLSRIGREQVSAFRGKYKAAGEALSGIKELKLLGRELSYVKRFSAQAWRHAVNSISVGLISQMPRFVLEIVAFGGILLIVLKSLHAEQGASDLIPLLALYAFSGYRLLPALQLVFQSMASLRSSIAALDVLYNDLVRDSEHGIHAEEWLQNRKSTDRLHFLQELRLKDISFRYPGAEIDSLSNIDLCIAANTSVGFVGTTGSGKTTIADIILGLLSPTSGKLSVDGTEITAQNLPKWQRNLGYVPQHIYISDDTITRNIAFAVPDSEVDMDAVRHAARIANLEDFVSEELPDGLNTNIGERGIKLSGGQRQRIGIARALYTDPALLVLDEATSALDGVTENSVMEALNALSSKKTTILIAHRLTTVKDCDVIYLLEDGSITAAGTYSDLLKTSRWFRTASGE